ncbi:MAG: metal-dependent hydrolase [Bdellovibrionales bacterium]|nr:metal-dependent hydrolase [Bdellovibrionales bacterium]
MASAFGHSLAAYTIAKTAKGPRLTGKLAFWSALSGVLPDADVISFRFGIPYGDPLGHRGLTHSLLFGALWSLLVARLVFRREERRGTTFFVLLLASYSHGLLDAMTTGGQGVGFFIPFSNERYFFPFRPIEVSPIGVTRFFDQARAILASECVWIGVPCLIVLFAARIFWRRRTARD